MNLEVNLVQRCCHCHAVRPVTEFGFRNRERRRRQAICRYCKTAYNRDWYRRNRAKQLADVARTKTVRRRKSQHLVAELKKRPCTDCHATLPPEAMDFDHVRGVKRGDVSALVNQGSSIVRVRSEIEKCDLVCANCHRVRTKGRSLPVRAAGAGRRRSRSGRPSLVRDGQLTLF